jgi:hypothetical protein
MFETGLGGVETKSTKVFEAYSLTFLLLRKKLEKLPCFSNFGWGEIIW